MLNPIRRWKAREQAAIEQVVRNTIKDESDRLQANLRELREANLRLSHDLATTKGKNIEYAKKLREQTEADLVLVSLRLVAKALKGEPRDSALEQRRLQLQQDLAMFRTPSHSSPYAATLGVLSGLDQGVAGILGAH